MTQPFSNKFWLCSPIRVPEKIACNSRITGILSRSFLQPVRLEEDRFVDPKQAPQNIQDGFLNLARREKTTVTIYLVNGAKLLGRIKSFDKFSLLLETGSQDQLIFKHAISTISQARRSTGELRHSTLPADSPSDQPEPPPA